MDLKTALRNEQTPGALDHALDQAVGRKPLGHDFEINPLKPAAVSRFMSVTGG